MTHAVTLHPTTPQASRVGFWRVGVRFLGLAFSGLRPHTHTRMLHAHAHEDI